jgi:mitochondrial import receptor subunit TOM40
MHGQIDPAGSLMARGQYNWIAVPVPPQPNPEKPDAVPEPPVQPETTSASKFQAQMPFMGQGQSVMQLEHEHVGKDFAVTVKAINPSFSTQARPGMGFGAIPETYSISMLQSVSRSLALGGEVAYPRMGPGMHFLDFI